MPTNFTAMIFGYKTKPNFTVAERSADLDAADGELRQAGVALSPAARARDARAPRRGGCCSPRSSSAAALAEDVVAGAAADRPRHRPDRHADAGAGARRSSAKLAAIEQERGAQIVVLIVPTTQPEDIAAFAQRVASTLEDRPARKSATACCIVGREERPRRRHRRSRRRSRARSPTSLAGRIIREQIAPAFRAGDYAGGLNAAVDRIGRARRRREAAAAARRARGRRSHAAAAASTGRTWRSSSSSACRSSAGMLSGIMGRKLGALATGGARRRDRLVADREPARRRRRRPRRALFSSA